MSRDTKPLQTFPLTPACALGIDPSRRLVFYCLQPHAFVFITPVHTQAQLDILMQGLQELRSYLPED